MTDLVHAASDSLDADLVLFIAETMPVDRYELRQLQAGGGEARVRDIRPSQGEGASEIAERVWAIACSDAKQLTGVNAYALLAFKAGATAYEARQSFRVPVTSTSNALAPTEPATLPGLIAQLMRHTEASTRTAVLGSGDLIRIYQKEVKELRDYIRKLESRSIRAFELIEELTQAKADRDLVARREQRADERQAHVLGQFTRYLPALVDRALIATGLVKEGQAPASNAARLGSIVRSLEVDQLKGIVDIIGEAKGRELLDILQSVVAAEEACDPKAAQNGAVKHAPS